MIESPAYLREAINAIKSKDYARARALLRDILAANPRDDNAWLLLSTTLSSLVQQRECLQRALAINPHNAIAQRELVRIEGAAARAVAASPVEQRVNATPAPAGGSVAQATVSSPPRSLVAFPPSPAIETAAPAPTPSTRAPGPAEPKPRSGFVYPLNMRLGLYTIIEYVGKRGDRELYLAKQHDPKWLFWLVCDPEPIRVPMAVQQQDEFAYMERHHLVVAAAGTKIALLQHLIGSTQIRFGVKRWIGVVEGLGYLHNKDEVYTAMQRFTLQGFLVSGDANFTSVSFADHQTDAEAYTSPEHGHGVLTPASDVYVLGAALLTIIGEAPPDQVFHKRQPVVGKLTHAPALYRVLQKATSTNPRERYSDAPAFAEALRLIVDELPPEDGLVAPSRPLFSLTAIIGAVLVILIGVILPFIAFAALQKPPVVAQVLRVTQQPPVAVTTPIALPTLVPLPQGELALSDVKIEPEGDRTGSVSFLLTKGGVVVPEGTPLEVNLFHNRVEVLDLDEPANSGEHYTFDLSTQIAVGIYELLVRVADQEVYAWTYFNSGADTQDLSQVHVGGTQIDTINYPSISVYFNLLDSNEQPVHLGGNIAVTVLQDGVAVKGLTMQPVDAAVDPATVALAIDVSGSMRGVPLAAAKAAAANFVGQLRSRDQVCLYRFATTVQNLAPCTTDHSLVLDLIADLETIDDTALYDALSTIASDLAEREGRRAIVVLSDGADTKSATTFEAAVAGIKISNVPVYTIGLLSDRFDGDVLQRLAKEGNAIYLEASSPDAIDVLYSRIDQQLTNQYRISFGSAFPDRNTGHSLSE